MIYKNPSATHKNIYAKARDYYISCLNCEQVVDKKANKTPLWLADINRVEFIGGLWRIQIDFPYKIERVRDKDFVVMEKLPRQEKNLFDFYRAKTVTFNCYGPFIMPDDWDYVAKYETDEYTYCAYGRTIEQARAFLGIKLYDECADLIHEKLCKKICKNKQK